LLSGDAYELRREGLSSSHLTAWRKERDASALSTRLTHRLQRAETIIEVRKQVASMLGHPLEKSENA